jgi:hypothetical protein
VENPDARSGPVTLNLSADEAVVLFELLSRFEQDGRLDIADAAEGEVLSGLLAQLERRLVAPFDDRYAEMLRGARDRVRGAPA